MLEMDVRTELPCEVVYLQEHTMDLRDQVTVSLGIYEAHNLVV